MASRSPQTLESSGQHEAIARGAKLVEYLEFIEDQLRKTRSHVRSVDIAAGVMVLLAGTLGFFLFAALVDHWLFTGGMGFWGRLSFLVVYLAGAGWWIATQIVPLLVKKINPLYAAYTIEHSRPSLKNSLVNFLLFRSAPGSVHARVLEAIEEQAATSLVGVSTESAVDRARLVRLGYVLVAIVAVCALYAVVSPKNPFKTIGRVAMPWADIHPPTQTVIDEIEPGNAQAFRGQQVQVKARVQGLPDEGQVILYYTTDDRQIVDRAVEMSLPPGEYRHVAVLPSADGALQQSLSYRIEAGDARTPTYSLDVVAAPTIVVRAVEYKYPDYTGLLPQRIEHQGDLKAIEGTEVTLEALANQDIASAHIDFDCNDTPDLPLRGEGTSAKTKFRLSLDDERQRPQYASYQLTFKNTEGERNPQPVKHQIDVTRDLSPEVQFVAPSREEIEVPLDGVADLEIVAVDPDFALAGVRLLAEAEGQSLVDEKLLGEPWRGQFVKKYRFAPGRYKLKTGDVVEYWATATDNKSPRPNTAQTARRRIRIVAPTGRGSRGDELAKKQSRDNDRRPGDEARPGGDELAAREAKPGEDADAAQEAVDQSPDSQDAASQRQQGDDQPGKSGEQNDAQQQNDSSGQGDQDGQSSSSDGKQGEQSGGESDDGQSNDGKSNDGKSGDGQSGQNQSSDGQQGSQQSGQGNSGQRGAEGQSGGDENSGQQGSNEQGSNEQGAGEQGAGEQGSRQSGSGQGETSSVPSDGTNDGEAFERILKHRDQQQDDDGSQNSDRQSGDQQRGDQAGKDSSGAKGDRASSGDRKDSRDGQRQQSSGDQNGGGDQQRRGDENPSGGQRASGEQSGDDSSRQQDTPGQDGGQDGDTTSGQKPGQSQPSDPQSQPGEPSRSKQSEKPQGEKQSDQPGRDTPGSQEDGQGNADQPGQQSQGDKPNDGQRQRGEGDSAQQQEGRQQSGERPQQGDATDSREPGASQDNNTADDGTPQNSDTQGQGAQSKDDPTRNADQQSQQSGEQRPDAKGGDGEQSKGNSGAGQQSNDQQGSPHSQESQQPREKSGQPGQSSEQSSREGQEQSPSNSKRESDSQGQEDGDRSGGGKKGGGQKSNQSGTGSAGQNTAADEGAGQSEQSGDGETSDRPGDDRESDGKTGQSGSKQGEGSESQSASGKDGKPGGQSASGQSSGDTLPEEEDSEDSQSQDNSNAGSGNPQGGDRSRGQPPKSVNLPDQAFKPGQDEADQANLEYTRKATDLALEHLKHELNKQQPDQELLDRLGWTREQAEDFVNRWEKMRQAGPSGDKSTGGRRELDDTLRSLGLRPRGSQLGSNSKRDDRSAGYQESHRTTPPPEYSEAFKAYTQGTARGGK